MEYHVSGKLLSNILLVKNDRRNRPNFAMLEMAPRGKRFSLLNRCKWCPFLHATVYELKKIVRFAWSGNLYKFLCLFWIRTYSLAIFKTIEVKNSSVAAVESINFDDVLLMGRTFEEILMSRNTLIFSALTYKFCHKSEKISPENGQVNIIFRPTNRYTCRDFDYSGKRWKR